MFKIKIINNLLISITMFFISFSIIFAVPASPNLMEITQPNGAKFKAYLKGDEYFSWWESEKGLALYRNLVSGYFEYAKISIIDEKEELVTTGVIFISGEEPTISNARISKQMKMNLGKIWKGKRKQARKKIQKNLEKQKQARKQ
jgi:hypothetical protein